MADMVEVLVPDLGDVKDVPVLEVLVHVGDQVLVDQTLAMLETEKATMDVPSTAAGKVSEVRVRVGDKVNQGSVLVLLETAVAAEPVAQPSPPAAAIPEPPAVQAPVPPDAVLPATATAPAPLTPPSAEPPEPQPASLPHASPSIRRLARELGLSLATVAGTGPKGRILQSDLYTSVKTALAAPAQPAAKAPTSTQTAAGLDLLPWPQIDFARFGPVDRAPLSKIKKIAAANLTRNAILIPHVTNFDEADITGLEEFRVEINKQQSLDKATRLTMLTFLIKASVYALRLHPTFNASLDGNDLVLKRYFHIGFAADTPNGLVVPVIRDADTKGLVAIAAEVSELAAKARQGKLQPAEMQGGCFTVSSLGGIGGTGFTPIINAPEVAILGAARSRMAPVWNGEAFGPRLVLPISLSWDHRVVDGVAAARFLVTMTSILQDFRRVLL